MYKTNTLVKFTLCAAALMAFSSSSFAAATWNFSNTTVGNPDGCQAGTQGAGYGEILAGTAVPSQPTKVGNAYKCKATTGTGPAVTVTAWGRHQTLTGFQQANVSPQTASGFGVKSQLEIATDTDTSPNHSMDNQDSNGTPDLFLLSFATAVSLSEVVVGWWQTDADFTLMAYKNPGDPTVAPTIQGKTAATSGAGLLTGGTGAGWILVENSGDADQNAAQTMSNNRSVNTANPSNPTTSSWWLISAYNSGYGAGALDTNRSDYIKLLSVSSRDVPTTGVAEPGSMALVGLALAGALFVRRRNSQAYC